MYSLKNKVFVYITLMILAIAILPSLSAAAQCVSGSEYINIISPDTYSIGQNVGNVSIKLNANTFDFTKSKVTAILTDGTTEVGSKITNGFVNANGVLAVDFKYTSPRSANLVIKIIVDNGVGQKIQASKPIKVLPTLDNKLTCDVQGYINRDITCTWKTYDKDTATLVATNPPVISVKQGTADLAYNSAGSNGISFQTGAIGSVSVKITVSKDGYNSDTDNVDISVQTITTQSTFSVDNKDFFTYSGFTTGVHSLEISATDSGIASDVARIDATITSPSNQKIPVTFTKVSTGVFKTSYTLSEPGQTYSLDGSIVYAGDRDSIPFSYKLATSGTTTEDLAGQTNIILVSAIAGGVVLVLFIGLAIWLKKEEVEDGLPIL